MSSRHDSHGPLEGLKIVDLTRMLAGPFCTMLFADMGADVIKVEPPRGDLTRYEGPFLSNDSQRHYGGYFQSINRNKRSVVLDLTTAADRQRFLRLVAHADVVVENFRPGIMERWQLEYERLAFLNPGLVYGAIRGFGDPRSGESHLGDWPAYDIVAQAMGGLIGITGTPGQPVKVGPGIGDVFPAALCATGILAALHERRRSGLGQFVDVAMYDSIVALCERIVHQYSYTGQIAEPEGNGHPMFCPFDLFPCRDGFVAIAAPTERHWRHLVTVMGMPELAERYTTNADRVANAETVRRHIVEWTSTRSKKEVIEPLAGHVPAGPVNTVEDIVNDPHLAVRAMLVQLDQPGTEQSVTVAGSPIKFSRTPQTTFTRAPLHGEHTAELCDDPVVDGQSSDHSPTSQPSGGVSTNDG